MNTVSWVGSEHLSIKSSTNSLYLLGKCLQERTKVTQEGHSQRYDDSHWDWLIILSCIIILISQILTWIPFTKFLLPCMKRCEGSSWKHFWWVIILCTQEEGRAMTEREVGQERRENSLPISHSSYPRPPPRTWVPKEISIGIVSTLASPGHSSEFLWAQTEVNKIPWSVQSCIYSY